MYASIIQHLDIQSGQSMLNIGSGSGYFSCIIAVLLGSCGLSHGIDISELVVNHSKVCIGNWISSMIMKRNEEIMHAEANSVPALSHESIKIVQGNCFDININDCRQMCTYDRIYIGAGCPSSHYKYFLPLLADNGIMIVPLDDQNKLLKVKVIASKTKFKKAIYTFSYVSNVTFARLLSVPATIRVEGDDTAINVDPQQQSEQQLQQTPLPPQQKTIAVKLPVVRWEPHRNIHRQYPKRFKDSIYLIALAATRGNSRSNKVIISSLPAHLWIFIFTFMSRDWFVPVLSEVELLTQELEYERETRQSVEIELEKLKVEQQLFSVIFHKLFSNPLQGLSLIPSLVGIATRLPLTVRSQFYMLLGSLLGADIMDDFVGSDDDLAPLDNDDGTVDTIDVDYYEDEDDDVDDNDGDMHDNHYQYADALHHEVYDIEHHGDYAAAGADRYVLNDFIDEVYENFDDDDDDIVTDEQSVSDGRMISLDADIADDFADDVADGNDANDAALNNGDDGRSSTQLTDSFSVSNIY